MRVRRLTCESTVGSGKQGQLNSDVYDEKKLTAIFGKPTEPNDGKTTKEWRMDIGGVTVTIYDYNGFEWSIGGYGEMAVVALRCILDDVPEACQANGEQR